MNHKLAKVRVVSLFPNVCGLESVIAAAAELAESGGGYICFATVHMVMEAFDDAAYAAKVNAADVIVPDGMPLVWMQKRLGHRGSNRVRANDLMIALCKYAEAKGRSVGFYGAAPNVIEDIKRRAASEFPELEVAYAYSPPFRVLTEDEDAEIVSKINAAAPEFLFVGLGCPKQENWMHDHRDQMKTVSLGVGASFDFFAGNVRECPPWIGAIGLEWLFRLSQEPRRLWRRYLVLNPRFMWQAARQLFGSRRPN